MVPLHLVRLDSTKDAQRRADTGPTASEAKNPSVTLTCTKTGMTWPHPSPSSLLQLPRVSQKMMDAQTNSCSVLFPFFLEEDSLVFYAC